ncbi:MAG: hypothetical protein EPO52_12840 [Herbiconiux sp.]|uniref:hypothetical protein n=1 Tax=Herbiconiux sp. TaxID=1871186 RepID=UPI001222BFE2|nr:hypothetical protein [Herbiconiux sp.]TAJ47165.1 MAG: hypothetical protein EPO52_12840 [Herbiconiux sp.]
MLNDHSSENPHEKKSWLVRGEENSTWFFAGATFAFAGATWAFTSHVYLLGGLLVAAATVSIAVGIVVWQRGSGGRSTEPTESDAVVGPPPTRDGAAPPPPPRI